MAIGYACIVIGEPNTGLSSCVLKNAAPEKITVVSRANLAALEAMIDYNISHGIRLFRISSDIIPFSTHPVNTIDWRRLFKEQFDRIGEKIRQGGIRVSMHPGQYTVLNSPHENVVQKAFLDLQYHGDFLDALGVDRSCKLILHIGGVYGDKKQAVRTFVKNYAALPESIKSRLVIENDDRNYHVLDVLALSHEISIPVVFDTLHHALNAPAQEKDLREWVSLCGETWGKKDGRQKLHYSQPKIGGKQGAHSDTICLKDFLQFYQLVSEASPDIMLEVKDKNLSAIKCIQGKTAHLPVKELEEQWARYKYLVLSRSAVCYQKIRNLLKDKTRPSAAQFYDIIEASQRLPLDYGAALNGAQHVWGYVSKAATPSERRRFDKLAGEFAAGNIQEKILKNHLYQCAVRQNVKYLKRSYYFYL